MTPTPDIPALLRAAGVAPDDTEQLVILMPRPATVEAMDALTLTLRELQDPESRGPTTLIQHDGDGYVDTPLEAGA